MKKHFPAYYRVRQDWLIKDFGQCVIVFDTSALLDIYRLPKDSVDQVFDVLEHYKKQIVIPHYTAVEYYRSIHGVLLAQITKITKAQTALDDLIQMLSTRRNQPYISDKSNRHLTTLKNSVTRDFEEQKAYLKDQLLYGGYQNKMAELLDGCVLDPFTDKEIKEIEKIGEDRYTNHIPPGWKDAEKGANRYGDLIIWKEVLRFAKDKKKSILYISNDQKEDWVIKATGMTICPQYGLLEEFYNEVGDSNLWLHIFTLDRFLDFVNKISPARVSKETVDQVRESIANEIVEPTNSLYDFFKSQQKLIDMSSIAQTQKAIRSIQDIYDRYKFYDQINAVPQDLLNMRKNKLTTVLGSALDVMKATTEAKNSLEEAEEADKKGLSPEEGKTDPKDS